jgi:hypothetical protein
MGNDRGLSRGGTGDRARRWIMIGEERSQFGVVGKVLGERSRSGNGFGDFVFTHLHVPKGERRFSLNEEVAPNTRTITATTPAVDRVTPGRVTFTWQRTGMTDWPLFKTVHVQHCVQSGTVRAARIA